MAGKTTKQEVDTHWSINDLADCHDAMAIESEIETVVTERTRRKQGIKK